MNEPNQPEKGKPAPEGGASAHLTSSENPAQQRQLRQQGFLENLTLLYASAGSQQQHGPASSQHQASAHASTQAATRAAAQAAARAQQEEDELVEYGVWAANQAAISEVWGDDEEVCRIE